jgi:nicotinamidase-related amidase
METALLLINFQNDYFPNGRVTVDRSLEVSIKAHELANVFRSYQKPVIYIQEIATRPDATYFLPCTKGIEFHPNVTPQKQDLVIKKHHPNCFKDTGLLQHLNKLNITHLTICGMTTNLCIDATVRAATDLGIICTIVADACASRAVTFGNISLSADQVNAAYLATLKANYASVLTAIEVISSLNIAAADQYSVV